MVGNGDGRLPSASRAVTVGWFCQSHCKRSDLIISGRPSQLMPCGLIPSDDALPVLSKKLSQLLQNFKTFLFPLKSPDAFVAPEQFPFWLAAMLKNPPSAKIVLAQNAS